METAEVSYLTLRGCKCHRFHDTRASRGPAVLYGDNGIKLSFWDGPRAYGTFQATFI